MGNGTFQILTAPDLEADGPSGDRLLRPYFDMHRLEFPDTSAVEFHLGDGGWIRLRANGFEIEDLIEVRTPVGATTTWDLVTPEWAQQWPVEEIWKARRR